jgi:hypothetical protein
MWYMDIKCTGVSAAPGLLLMVSSIKYTSISCMTSLPQYVPYLYVERNVYSEKGSLVTKQTFLKFFSSCMSFCGFIIYVWHVLKAGNESSGSSLVLEKVCHLVMKELKVCWQKLTTQNCLVDVNQKSMRIKCFADE